MVLAGFAQAASAEELTIATVNNGDMIVMQKLSAEFTKQHPDITLNWVTLEENVLRQRLTTDIGAGSGQFDVFTIGMFEAPLWGKNGWLVPFDDTPAEYDVNDILPKVRDGLSYDGKLYALPFYGESTMTMYNKAVLDAKGLTMPEAPTWDDIAKIAEATNDPAKEQYGICLRGKPGWGENMGPITLMANTFGGRIFDENWKSQWNSPEWNAAVNFYVNLVTKFGPPGVVNNGFNENLALFNEGHCTMWIDATVAAGFVSDPRQSKVAATVGYAAAPTQVTDKGAQWLWAWSLAIPTSSKKVDAAKTFIEWATSKEYQKLVADNVGWGNVPPGTRTSLYETKEYLDAAPFAAQTLKAMNAADPIDSTLQPKPYTGISFAIIPEYQGIGTFAGQQIAGAIAGSSSVADALAAAAANADREMKQAGYIK